MVGDLVAFQIFSWYQTKLTVYGIDLLLFIRCTFDSPFLIAFFIIVVNV